MSDFEAKELFKIIGRNRTKRKLEFPSLALF